MASKKRTTAGHRPAVPRLGDSSEQWKLPGTPATIASRRASAPFLLRPESKKKVGAGKSKDGELQSKPTTSAEHRDVKLLEKKVDAFIANSKSSETVDKKGLHDLTLKVDKLVEKQYDMSADMAEIRKDLWKLSAVVPDLGEFQELKKQLCEVQASVQVLKEEKLENEQLIEEIKMLRGKLASKEGQGEGQVEHYNDGEGPVVFKAVTDFCDRPVVLLTCTKCQYKLHGRVRRYCPKHPMALQKMDISACPACNHDEFESKEYGMQKSD